MTSRQRRRTGIPALCQIAGECARTIRDGVNGTLAGSKRELEEKLESLIVSPDLRRGIGERAIQPGNSQAE